MHFVALTLESNQLQLVSKNQSWDTLRLKYSRKLEPRRNDLELNNKPYLRNSYDLEDMKRLKVQEM